MKSKIEFTKADESSFDGTCVDRYSADEAALFSQHDAKPNVSGRLSSYQKMKQKYEASIRQLTDDIITLVEEKDFMKTTTLKIQWRMRLDIEKVIWAGDATCH